MKAVSLQSGSNGNCIYVETDDVRILFDAGISGIQAERRLKEVGRDIRDVDCVIISHDHWDHARCAGIFSRKYRLNVWMTPKTYSKVNSTGSCGLFHELSHFGAGEILRFGNTSVITIPTPHDGVDGVAFIVDDSLSRLGILTDLGHVFDGLPELIMTLDGVFLESNYDVSKLENGPYPAFLKNRIKGKSGHISNIEAADLLTPAFRKKLKWACLAHLSQQNNDPRTAIDTHRKIIGGSAELSVASRYGVSSLLSL
ncbi:MAG: MBL fold metallo-hydrolase [Candidatus Krumholzibacteriota bacterium]|nr:MBL fold metallo-hydrolase [Candidatus Krumholzibacteriota bacterium]